MNYAEALQDIAAEVEPHLGRGKVADYIPALAEADPKAFAMSVMTIDGERCAVGSHEQRFSIQSISKVFALARALRAEGDELWRRVGREPSGTAFNSIVQLEKEQGVPRNPFINAGAMVVTDAILSHCSPNTAIQEILDFINEAACADVGIDDRVAASEKAWGDRNRSLAYFMKSFGVIRNDTEDVLDTYFQQCAVAMSTDELVCAGLFLANDGAQPRTGAQLATHAQVNRINALMLTCGHYDRSGDFAFRTGLPGKSGVGGGILCVVPRECAVAVWSPALNEAGNSLAGTIALELFSEKTGFNMF